MPSPSEYIPLVNAQADANRVNTYTPYGSTVFSPVPGAQKKEKQQKPPQLSTKGGKQGVLQNARQMRSYGEQSKPEKTQSVTSFSPEVQNLFNRQISMAGGAGDFNQDVENAVFQRSMNLLEPGFQRQMGDFQQSMADRGLPSGGRAYDDEFANINRAQNSARENAALSAVLAGKDTAFRDRNQSFNELASILGQNQTAPTAPVDVMGPANMALNSAMANQQAQQGKKSSGVNAGAQLGAAYLLSDRRTKENIRVIGEFIPGIDIHEFNYIGNPDRQIGFMSDQVKKIFPEAVVTRDDGLEMVNYGFFFNG